MCSVRVCRSVGYIQAPLYGHGAVEILRFVTGRLPLILVTHFMVIDFLATCNLLWEIGVYKPAYINTYVTEYSPAHLCFNQKTHIQRTWYETTHFMRNELFLLFCKYSTSCHTASLFPRIFCVASLESMVLPMFHSLHFNTEDSRYIFVRNVGNEV